MKEQMIGYLQTLIDGYKKEREEGFIDFSNDYIERFRACKRMYEELTGEEVTVINWKVGTKK